MWTRTVNRKCCKCGVYCYSNDTVPFCDWCNPYRELYLNNLPEGERGVKESIIVDSSSDEDWYSTL